MSTRFERLTLAVLTAVLVNMATTACKAQIIEAIDRNTAAVEAAACACPP